MIITVKDEKFRLIDFDKEVTIALEEVASEVFSDALGTILTSNGKFSLTNFLKGLIETNNMRRGLALIFWEEKGEKFFDKDAYEKRIVKFLNMSSQTRKKATPEVGRFFDGIGDSIMGDFQIFNGAFLKLDGKNTTDS